MSLPFPKPHHLQNKMAASTSDDGHEDSGGKGPGEGAGHGACLKQGHTARGEGTHTFHPCPTWTPGA